jgi:hypothetical protein
MKLNLKFLGLQDCVFSIMFNGKKEIVDSFKQDVSFDFGSKQEYTIEIEQIMPKKINYLLSILLFAITCLIQGVFNILLMNTDSKWYSDINPYRIKAKYKIVLNADTSMVINYIKSSYNGTWSAPILKINDIQILDIELFPMDIDFKKQYSRYVKKLISVLSVALVILSFLLGVSISSHNRFAIIFITALITAIMALVVGITICEYKRMKKLYNGFVSGR